MQQNSALFSAKHFHCVNRARCLTFHPVAGMCVVALSNHGNSAAVLTRGPVLLQCQFSVVRGVCLEVRLLSQSRDDSPS